MGKLESWDTGGGRLPADLAAMLAPELQDALDHPLRREVLRSLIGKKRARTPGELVERLAPFSPSQIDYHLRVLVGTGAVESDGGAPLGALRYVAALSERPQAIAVLQATERGDRERREALAGGPRLRASGAAGE